MEIFSRMALAGWVASVSEQDSWPAPYRSAVSWAKSAIERARLAAMEQARARQP